MNIKKTVILLVGNMALLQAQTSDTLLTVPDSLIQVKNHTSSLKNKNIFGIAIPAVMITYGVISIESDGLKQLDYSTRNELIEDRSLWHNGWDDYLQFSPAALVFCLKLSGIESRHNLSDMLILYTLSNALQAGVVFSTKSLTGRERPDGSNYHSFPSGHTATAFVAAEFLHQEYGDKSVWISAGGYGMATLIGISRIYNNRHWVSDVVAGAGVGILSTKMTYWLYPSIKKTFSNKAKKHQVLLCPNYNNGTSSLNFLCIF